MDITEKQVVDVLKQCYDPEIPIDLWNLGLIYDVGIEPAPDEVNSNVNILMSLTTPGCGMAGHIAEDIKNKIEAISGVFQVNVEITFDPPWTPEMISEEAKVKLGFGKEPQDTLQSPAGAEEESRTWE